MGNSSVTYEVSESVATITLNRPERLNAINLSLLQGLMERLEQSRKDREVKAVILTGAGRAFCAGEDLKETAKGKSLPDWLEEIDRLQDIQRLALRLGKPLIAAVNGYAVGGGCEFAMSCDMRLASASAQFGFPETGVGLTVTTAGTKLLTHLVGLGRAKELLFTGDFIDAERALEIGLVNQVVPADELMPHARSLAKRIAQRSPLALRLTRIAVDQGLEASIEQILELEASHLLSCVSLGNQEELVAKKLGEMKKDKP